jgi:hypothetical protein
MVAVATLSGLLMENAAEAAPALVMKELGKMALVGSQVAAASAAGSAAAAAGSGAAATAGAGAKAAATGVAAGIKVKVVTAAAVAAVGVGSVATLHYTSGPSDKSASQQVVQDVDEGTRSTPMTRRQRRSASRAPLVQQSPDTSLADSQAGQGYPGMSDPRSFEEMFGMMGGEAMADAQQTEPDSIGGFGMGGMATRTTRTTRTTRRRPAQAEEGEVQQTTTYFSMGYGGGMAVSSTRTSSDASDANDSDEESSSDD